MKLTHSLWNLQKFIQYQHFSSEFFTRLTILSDMMDPFFIFYLIQGSLIIQLGWTLPISIQLGLKTSWFHFHLFLKTSRSKICCLYILFSFTKITYIYFAKMVLTDDHPATPYFQNVSRWLSCNIRHDFYAAKIRNTWMRTRGMLSYFLVPLLDH